MSASHAAAVAVYAHDIAKELGLTEEMCKLALLCGLVHDIGKHNVVADLIDKPAKLSEAEFALVQQHSAIGETLILYVAEVVRSHHERIDGEGYPDRLSKDEIPLLSKIVGVADAYNAMTTVRPYRNPLPPEEAIRRLTENKGRQFDPAAVDAFIKLLADKSDEYQTGRRIAPEFDAIISEFSEWLI